MTLTTRTWQIVRYICSLLLLPLGAYFSHETYLAFLEGYPQVVWAGAAVSAILFVACFSFLFQTWLREDHWSSEALAENFKELKVLKNQNGTALWIAGIAWVMTGSAEAYPIFGLASLFASGVALISLLVGLQYMFQLRNTNGHKLKHVLDGKVKSHYVMGADGELWEENSDEERTIRR